MSAIGSWFARAIAAVGGPQTAVVVLVAGLVVGVGGGALITLNARNGGAAGTGSVSVYPCPNQGPALLTIANGQQLLVTGRLADSSWVRIHLPTPGRTEGWVEAGPLTVNGSIDALPVATCAAEAGAPSPAVVPVESLTAIVNATPSPELTPTPSPSPSPTASSNTGPSLASLAASARTISYDQGSYCPTAVKSVTISVKASDASGVSGIVLFWREPGAATYAQTPMHRTSGSATSGGWQATLDTTANGITAAGTLSYYAVGTDTAGATTKTPASGSASIAVAVCANTGPTITGASSSSGSSLYWDPLGVGRCQTASNITAAVSDVDGVKSVTLYFRRPGSSTWSSKPMDNQTIPGKWYANLDTLGDKISIPTPPTGTLSWYIKAVDRANKSSVTKTASITIRRCDSPATFYVNDLAKTYYTYCSGNPNYNTWINLIWTFSITDPDGIKSATLSYRIVNNASGQSYSQKLSTTVGSQRFSMTSGRIDGRTFNGSNSVTWTITTTDKYGGRSSNSFKGTVMILVC